MRPSTLSFFGHNKDRQRCIGRFSAGLEGLTGWMMNVELELIVPRRDVSERHCSPTLKQKVAKGVRADTYHPKQ